MVETVFHAKYLGQKLYGEMSFESFEADTYHRCLMIEDCSSCGLFKAQHPSEVTRTESMYMSSH